MSIRSRRFNGSRPRSAKGTRFLLEQLESRQLLSASISGNVYQDLSGNGVRNGADNGLLNWTIHLDRNADGVTDATTFTDADGNYSFAGLIAATYRITEVAPGSWMRTTPQPADIAAGANSVVTGVNFGNFQKVTLNGQLYDDADASGTQDSGEAPLVGWTVQLDKDANGTVDATTTTDSNGTYNFLGIGPGKYRIRQVLQSGWTQTTSNPADITTTSGWSIVGINFGDSDAAVVGTGSISGHRFQDFNGNGIQDAGDTPLSAGWGYNLDKGADGTIDATTTGDANGDYTFGNLAPGVYRVTGTGIAGWMRTTPTIADINLADAQASTGNDFGNFKLITISGNVFRDADGGGTKDAGEGGLSGWTIQLDKGANGSVDATTTTDINGNYSFANLNPGTYRVREVLKSDYTQTTTNPADIVASSGTNVGNVLFGDQQNVTLIASGVSFNATEGAALNGIKVAGFTSGDPSAVPSDFTTSIDWGDGTAATNGSVVSDGQGGFRVNGTHTYKTSGVLGVTVSISDNASHSTSANSSAHVADAPLTASAKTIQAVRNRSFTALVATFTDANPFAVANEYSVSIKWGDGITSVGSVIFNNTTHLFEVRGTHTYSKNGTFTVAVAILDDGGATTTANSTANVSQH